MLTKLDRAKQFLPFAALKGFDELIAEKQRIVVPKKQLMPDWQENLDFKLQQLKVGDIIAITHYNNGEYILTEGVLSVLNKQEKYLQIVKTKILLENIIEINGQTLKDIWE